MGCRIDWSGGLWEPTDTYAEAVGIIRETYQDAVIGHAGDLEYGGGPDPCMELRRGCRGRRRSPIGCGHPSGPVGWFFSGLLIWIVAFPLYLASRGNLKEAGERSREAGGRGMQ